MNLVSLHAANPSAMTGAGNWTYLIPGPEPLLIDAGVGLDAHLDAIAAAAPAGPLRVLVTHAHSDHASGASAIAARWPSTRFLKLPWPERDPKYAVPWQPIADGDRIATGEGDLEVIHTPGHAPDHVALWHPPSRTIFTGDLLVIGTTVVIPGSHSGSLALYLKSLERVRALKPLRAMPAHGAVIEDPEALIEKYIAHRARREADIRAALEAGPAKADALVSAIYGGLQKELVPMARESVMAHLLKLEAEGRVHRKDELWSLEPDLPATNDR
jgi:glyoxylase-like metal-dependent hydrolase (beta-lactamase superfamily II)